MGKIEKTSFKNRIVGYGDEPIDQIMFNPANWRIHPKSQQDALTGVLEEIGWVQNVIINKRTGHLVDGHLRVQLADRAGEKTIPVTYVDLSEAEEMTVLATIDPIAAMAATDKEKLDEVLRQVHADDARIQKAIADLAANEGLYKTDDGKDTEPQIDKAEELRVKWGVESGQLWELGDHRLICGDCTDKAVVEKVMQWERAELVFTDPPYGMNKDFENDNLSDMMKFHESWIVNVKEVAEVMLCWYDPKRIREIIIPADAMFATMTDYLHMYKPNDVAFPLRSWIRISESMLVFGKGKYQEVKPYAHDTYLYNHEHKDKSFYHPCVKPMDVVQDVISRFDADILLDVFSGSGTTIIACENLGRKCRAIEISPGYVAVALERWHQHTGKTPVQIA